MEQLGSHRTDFHEFWYLGMFQKSVKKIRLSLKSDKGMSHEDLCTVTIICHSLLLRMRNVSDKSCRENQNTRFRFSNVLRSGPRSSVGIATELRAGRSGDRIPVGRVFPPVQTGPGAHPASCTMGTGSFPRVKYGRGVLLTTHPLLVPRSWKSRAIPLPTL